MPVTLVTKKPTSHGTRGQHTVALSREGDKVQLEIRTIFYDEDNQPTGYTLRSDEEFELGQFLKACRVTPTDYKRLMRELKQREQMINQNQDEAKEQKDCEHEEVSE